MIVIIYGLNLYNTTITLSRLIQYLFEWWIETHPFLTFHSKSCKLDRWVLILVVTNGCLCCSNIFWSNTRWTWCISRRMYVKTCWKQYLERKIQWLWEKNMQEVNIWSKLWLQQIPNGNYIKVVAPYVMTKQEKKAFLHIIKNFKTPSSYATTLQSRMQKDGKLKGLKSHDYHMFMQHVLPLCLHNLMQEKTRMFLIRPNRLLNKLCWKVIDPNTMQVLRVKVVKTMSTLEKVFPPTCFDVMTHLVVHLVEELDLCGLVHTR